MKFAKAMCDNNSVYCVIPFLEYTFDIFQLFRQISQLFTQFNHER